MLPSAVIVRLVKPAPGPVVIVATTLPANSRSVALVVTTAAVVLAVPVPVPLAVPSTGAVGSAPAYSSIRTSGNDAAPLNVTVTVLLPAAALAMFFA